MLKLYKNRSLRTMLLALFATVTFVCSAIFIFDVEPAVMLRFFIISVVGTLLLIAAALVFTALRILLGRLFKR
ncbi:MAG: hypothetical protein ACI9WS_001776 [Paraglaciecola psychrophila]|jgi:hypothetical protein